jgi:hypothetical protein
MNSLHVYCIWEKAVDSTICSSSHIFYHQLKGRESRQSLKRVEGNSKIWKWQCQVCDINFYIPLKKKKKEEAQKSNNTEMEKRNQQKRRKKIEDIEFGETEMNIKRKEMINFFPLSLLL